MLHCDPDLLALLALGEDVAAREDALHLTSCAECREMLDGLRTVVAVARDVQPADRPADPPPEVWAGISAELGLTGPGPLVNPTPTPTPLPARGTRPDRPARADTALHRRAWQRPALLVAAAAAGVGVGVTATLLAVDRGPGAPDAATFVATTTLQPLPGWDAEGSATVVTTATGDRLLQVRLAAAEAGDGFQEVWLINKGVTGLLSLGVLDGSSGTFAIPAGVDLAQFPVVDVSLEPVDGDPAHSGDSIVRGTLGA